ncbi:uncharacterized protein LOC134078715 [Sardina pilchardus]|uniref:uncharacterized protein LOC134078715 n=1 Tax=Sardina pilchardus TaxID=27697 RepID=UPI002E0FA1A2
MLCFNALISLTLILSVNPSTAIEKTKVYGRKGGSITLLVNQQPMGKVTSIIWKHNKDKAAEWFEEDGVLTPTYYLNYVNVTNLDMETWSLTISDLQPKFMGEYSAEVNNKDPSQSWDLIILAAVRKPAINFKDVCNVTSCTLTCEGETSQKLRWYDADGRQISSDSMITVQKKDQDMEYTCQLSNEVSNATSSVKVPRLGDPSSNSAGLAVGIALLLIIIIAIAFILLFTFFRCKSTPGGKRRRTPQEIRNLWAFMPCIDAGTGTGTDAEKGDDENLPMITPKPDTTEDAGKQPAEKPEVEAVPDSQPTKDSAPQTVNNHTAEKPGDEHASPETPSNNKEDTKEDAGTQPAEKPEEAVPDSQPTKDSAPQTVNNHTAEKPGDEHASPETPSNNKEDTKEDAGTQPAEKPEEAVPDSQPTKDSAPQTVNNHTAEKPGDEHASPETPSNNKEDTTEDAGKQPAEKPEVDAVPDSQPTKDSAPQTVNNHTAEKPGDEHGSPETPSNNKEAV